MHRWSPSSQISLTGVLQQVPDASRDVIPRRCQLRARGSRSPVTVRSPVVYAALRSPREVRTYGNAVHPLRAEHMRRHGEVSPGSQGPCIPRRSHPRPACMPHTRACESSHPCMHAPLHEHPAERDRPFRPRETSFRSTHSCAKTLKLLYPARRSGVKRSSRSWRGPRPCPPFHAEREAQVRAFFPARPPPRAPSRCRRAGRDGRGMCAHLRPSTAASVTRKRVPMGLLVTERTVMHASLNATRR
ncbi:hypothetical protein FKP32DRAFT_1023955 [Trametes sanguinea]|nr:hypothetical protein FKP32DRAFT_1023955 [Trametes sanguinea]